MTDFMEMQAEMQAGELAWWKAQLRSPAGYHRILGIYGYRYLEVWFEEFNDLGEVIDIGSGPISAALIAERYADIRCFDSLAIPYRELLTDVPRLFLTADPTSLRAASADTVLLLNTLDHTTEPQALMTLAAHVLKPQGKLLIWLHLLPAPDPLHIKVGVDDVSRWCSVAGLEIVRQTIRHTVGPTQLYVTARRA